MENQEPLLQEENMTLAQLTNYINDFQYSIENILTNPYIHDDYQVVYLDNKKIWTAVHHKSFGLCYTLDYLMTMHWILIWRKACHVQKAL